jgi:NAD(P)-dependent dehydrogenase (short-subunit alcohol dehydrogenase family)
MIRMLIIGYVFALRSERALCRDVQGNLAYRWFCGLSTAMLDRLTAVADKLAGAVDKKAAFVAAVPLKRGAKPEEIADAITFLASGKASFITGQIIRVNGGKTAT